MEQPPKNPSATAMTVHLWHILLAFGILAAFLAICVIKWKLIIVREDVTALKSQVELLRKSLVLGSGASQNEKTESINQIPPIVYERPGLISEEARKELMRKVIQPILDYNGTSSIAAITIEALINEDSFHAPEGGTEKYIYGIKIIYKDGGSDSWLQAAKNGQLRWYIPTCDPSGCVFTPEFTSKYPEIVEQTK